MQMHDLGEPKVQLKKTIEGIQRSGQSFPEAAREFKLMLSGLESLNEKTAGLIEELLGEHQEQIRKRKKATGGKVVQEYGPGSSEGWYAGPREKGRYWPPLYETMKSGKMADAADGIDDESSNILAMTANPAVEGSSVRGLVLGHVQSGKTANFTAVMAKAADEGYRFFIVLAGMYNNLRRQTQMRLEKDIFRPDSKHPWHRLTLPDSDFGEPSNGNALFQNPAQPIVAVVKKNASRLENLRTFLEEIPEELRATVPAMIIDDESDQATPNTKADKDELSRINELVRDVWNLLPTSTYLAYTATPFANVLMDPDDEKDLYPRDFVYPLPRPDTYFGAAKVFGTAAQFALEDGDGGLDVVRAVPEDEIEALLPPKKDEDQDYDPGVVPSLADAVSWFVVATAIRYARGDGEQHSSMLVHNTHLVDPHAVQRDVLAEHVAQLKRSSETGDLAPLKAAFEAEADRLVEAFDNPVVPWEEVCQHLPQVLDRIEVIMDNGESLKRLDYPDDEPQVLVVVGGGTLSRGLTLEGLVVSHFVRRSGAYDTLLQMGRWFGYRNGYEDLVRVWTSAKLEEEYRFLAGVEEELREHLVSMAQNGESPRDVGVRVRSHPGRLEVTSRNKMFFAETVSVQLGGNRMQTTVFDPKDQDVLRRNQDAGRKLVHDAEAALGGKPAIVDGTNGSVLFEEVPEKLVTEFLDRYVVHQEHQSLQPELTLAWIQKHGEGRPWNVVLRSTSHPDKDPEKVFDFGNGHQVALMNRAPRESPQDRADIRALMPGADMLIDLSIKSRATGEEDPLQKAKNTAGMQKSRDAHGNVPLLVLYTIDKGSLPGDAAEHVPPRRPMKAEEHVVGLGLVFNQIDGNDAEYVAVRPTLKPDPELEDTFPTEDDEPDADVSFEETP